MSNDIENIKDSNRNFENNFSTLFKLIENSNSNQEAFLKQFDINELAKKIKAPIITKMEAINKKTDDRLVKIENNSLSLKNCLIKKGLLNDND